jgi:hypothetical protein
MNNCPSIDNSNPMYADFDDSCCAQCGAFLPVDPKPGTWAFDGFCNEACCAAYVTNHLDDMVTIIVIENDEDQAAFDAESDRIERNRE